MDREIRTFAESSLHGARPPEHWQDFDKSLNFIYGDTSATRMALLVLGMDDGIQFKSKNAPKELATLPRPKPPEQRMEPRPGIDEHFNTRLDRNQDGRVSFEEFDGPPHVFFETDRNNDGYLDRDEAEEIGSPPRGRFRRNGAPETPTFTQAFLTMETDSGNWRVGTFSDPNLTVHVAMDMVEFYSDINRFRTAFMIAVPLGLILMGIAGWFMAGRAMQPVAAIADTAEGITAKDLGKRIPMVGNDIELERLVTVSNNMLDRLQKSYNQAVRFSADAAHELQTPLTILQGELDNAIQSSEDGSTEQQNYSMLLDELRNLKAVVQKLLLLAHADEGRLNINPQSTDLGDLIESAVEDIEIMAPGLEIEKSIEEGIIVSADPALLNQTIRNMISNAAKYATGNGRVVFGLKQDAGSALFTLANTAPPIPDEDQPLLFDRFHRVDKARTTTGSGLGLSLAREIARAHGGDLVLAPYNDGMVSFTLTLPVHPGR
ncbi:ATP-binding protein [Pontiella desulfatans]|nr:ATP-binding protein [Pontiella desulfatans]